MTEKKKSSPKKETDLRKYLIAERSGEFVIEIPSTWKVTFGWVNPSARGAHGDGHCVRVWEGEKLRAVFDNVVRFRDLSIPLARKISRETGSAEWTQDSMGNFERHDKVDVDHELVEENINPFE